MSNEQREGGGWTYVVIALGIFLPVVAALTYWFVPVDTSLSREADPRLDTTMQ